MMLAATIAKELNLDPWSMDMDQFTGALRVILAMKNSGTTQEIVARMKAEREEYEL